MGQLTNRKWWEAAAVRAIKTAAETALGLIGTNVIGITDVNWEAAISASALAALTSLLWNLKGLPEVDLAEPKAGPSEPKADPDDTAELPRHLGR